MSYVVLARKYRPRRFAELVGQEHVVQALSNALQTQRLHHAYLFTGTRGIGKTTVSRILAKSLNCTGADGRGGITAEPCGVCSACTEIDADRYIDYIELDAASNRGIDEVRDMIERAAYKPAVGRFKVFMIDEAHQLTKEAFNALLKTLEEPPAYLKFVLATTDPEKMLPTVLSRCLQFNLRPMAPDSVRGHLQRVLQAEGVACDDGALRLLARAARGSMRDALSLTDQAIAYGAGALEEPVVRAMLGSVDRSHARELVRALAAHDAVAVLAQVDGLRSLGLSAAATLEEMALLLQQMAIEQAVPGALDSADADAAMACELALCLAPDETQLLYSMVLHGRGELGLMGDEHAAMTMVLLRFLAFPPAGAPAAGGAVRSGAVPGREARAATLRAPAPPAASRPLEAPPREVAAAPVGVPAPPPVPVTAQQPPEPAPAPVPAPVPAPAPTPVPARLDPVAPHASVDAAELSARWNTLVRGLIDAGSIAALVRELAWQAGLQRIEAGLGDEPARWHLCVEREPLRSEALADKLAAALTAALGSAVRLVLQPGVPTDTPALREAAARQARQAAAEAMIRSDPLVRELLQRFPGARIVPGSIRPLQAP